MKSDFLIAITQLSAEKHLPKEVVFEAVEAALVSAYKKDNFAANQNISVKVIPNTGEVKVYAQKTVVAETTDTRIQISLAEARRMKKDAEIGDVIEVEATPLHPGRIAAQTAKQVVLQRLREAEREIVFEEYADKEGDIVSGVIQRIEPKQIIVDLGKAEAILPVTEQVRAEHYRVGQRLKVYILEVSRSNKGPQIIVSRTHRNLLKRLFELEVPEIYNGIVEIQSIAREGGNRSKVAVSARQEGIDPVGSCVGLRGIRIQNIVNELNGERIDVVHWHPDLATFVANALSPAQVMNVELNEEEKTAYVVVPDKQLSLAIGKEGQNARLAAKLTGWRIDIKSASAAEAEKAERAAKALAEAPVQEAPLPSPVAKLRIDDRATEIEAPLPPVEPVESPAFDVLAVEETPSITKITKIEEAFPTEPEHAPEEAPEKPQIRFAEDLLAVIPTKPGKVKRGKGQKGTALRTEKEGVRAVPKGKKQRRQKVFFEEESLDEYV